VVGQHGAGRTAQNGLQASDVVAASVDDLVLVGDYDLNGIRRSFPLPVVVKLT